MIEYKKISLEDKALFDSYLSKDFFYLSDISFGNLYIWHKAREISFSIIGKCLVIRTCYVGEKPFYFYPIAGDEKDKIECIKELIKDCEERGEKLEFHSLESMSLQVLQKYFDGQFTFKSNRDRSDYIYSIKELIELSGRKYHKKKNHLNQFLQNYPDFTYQSIDATNKNKVLSVWKKWFSQLQGEVSQGLKNENIGIINALSDYELLGLKGGFVSVGSDIVAFSFGEVINSEMVVIHIEKADSDYHGAYQIINQQLLLNEFNSFVYANREEDLGIEGLRRAKMSYNPVFLVEKFEAIFDK
ncbi:DUF2156 domain-containing protein [Helicobacter cappadocius]|uniref:Phosphatidylglycerol lysyltransferase domain-containing protein n=1 Tax=Helicobacter cappadocius TaxID=3063998 RepID=A0AA90PXV1_9HELI|nr:MULTISPECIES: phosphatidylglycerol lysyltransferase domain-containing protein [unclassified Helicobacter]MDO7252621.1 phosphatidylglycerol lysyltransferase domain-containing protein [Helicobacter sp. faydin-H75]MDP2538488.1 phosphatidylglycerol lysyltransferase domain-containing protein [Helicobacter sp. faydin-H76]